MRFSREQVFRGALLALVFAIPFGTKKFLFSFSTPFTNFYTSEYTAAFLFMGDLLLVLAIAALALSGAWRRLHAAHGELRAFGFFAAALAAFAALPLLVAPYPAFGGYALLRLLAAVAAGAAVWGALRSGTVALAHLAGALGGSAAVQAVIALAQFFRQGSAGLSWLGETAALGPLTPGIANIIADGAPLLRAYGTLAHANILAGFLVLGMVALTYLALTSARTAVRIGAAAGMALVLAGILVSFSRSGWIVAALTLTLLFAFALANPAVRRRAAFLLFSVALSLALLIAALWFAVAPRAALTADEAPVRDRYVYNRMGFAFLAARPGGVGAGNELFYAFDRGMFHEFGLVARGQWQPIHNLYLLIGAEAGLAGLAAFLALLVVAFRRLDWRRDLAHALCGVMLLSLLLFGLFDHFLWDLQAGRLMLWVVLGILLGLGARSSTDRAYPSEG